MNIQETIAKHQKIALQFSGGKDSIACLYLLKEYWPLLTVYFLNSGDAFPETLSLISRIKKEVPNFIEVHGEVKRTISVFGIPSDVIPASSDYNAKLIDEKATGPRIINRYDCCSRSIMYPLHQRMYDDGITLIIRGQKDADSHKPYIKSGDKIDQFEFLFPIQDWTDNQVYSYILENKIRLSRLYQGFKSSGDCLTCSAWLSEGRGAYLKQYHPESYLIYQERLNTIADAVDVHAVHFKKEIS